MLTLKQRKIVALNQQSIENKKVRDEDASKYDELIEKYEYLKTVNKTHLADILTR